MPELDLRGRNFVSSCQFSVIIATLLKVVVINMTLACILSCFVPVRHGL